MAIPNFNLMWVHFPDHRQFPDLLTLFTSIGGQLTKNIHAPGFGPNGNTCAVRMSRALNYGAMPLSSKLVKAWKLNALVGGDKMLYLFRVSEMWAYIAQAIGAAPITVTKGFGKAFKGKRGIVAFTVEGWRDASGHLALWNGSQFLEPTHDDFRGLKDDPATRRHEPRTMGMTLWPI